MPYSRPKRSDLYTLNPRVNCLKTMPFTVAHTYIAHIWQYHPPPPQESHSLPILKIQQIPIPILPPSTTSF